MPAINDLSSCSLPPCSTVGISRELLGRDSPRVEHADGLVVLAFPHGRDRSVERRHGVAPAVLGQRRQLQDQHEADEDRGAVQPVDERGRRQSGQRCRDAEVQHHPLGPARDDAIEERRRRVAPVERHHGNQVEQSDPDSGPVDRGHLGVLEVPGGVQRAPAEGGDRRRSDRDVRERPGERDREGPPPRQLVRRVIGREAGHELERDRRFRAGGPGDDGVGELVDQREHGDAPGEPDAVRVEAVDRREHEHHQQEPGPHLHGEAEQAEGWSADGPIGRCGRDELHRSLIVEKGSYGEARAGPP